MGPVAAVLVACQLPSSRKSRTSCTGQGAGLLGATSVHGIACDIRVQRGTITKGPGEGHRQRLHTEVRWLRALLRRLQELAGRWLGLEVPSGGCKLVLAS